MPASLLQNKTLADVADGSLADIFDGPYEVSSLNSRELAVIATVEPLPVHRRGQTNLTSFSGKLRTGLPVAAKIALSTAGATTQIVGSPTPPQKS